ncbi:SagB/ThcOx family dehydrogenase [Paraburkholderia rhizosphaerae]|uniref:SagB-type dehydrogenase family enzyme n=1 Tax=Paraburkholderia rhizosphaerae TaxID=480658 RepID=A0A4V3HFN5_9BURK|nr:SagB/ThcOx family dehydrogenase [Paraburkholderia rhizosphaerae]TDY54109.1 SagB-type dehydrogenase family enzyme [Paraburkholderia rhizosphaerae]
MKRRELLVGLAAGALAAGSTSQAQQSHAPYTNEISLPKANTTGKVSLEEAIEQRRSVRRYGPNPLPVESIGQLLWAGQGITSADGKRASPSAGALYPLELYVVTATEVMHYLPQGHRAETRTSPDLRPKLQALALGQASVGAAPAVLVIAADAGRLSARYGARAQAYTDHEVGHAAQNMLLEATVLGLVAVPIAAVDGPKAARALALPHAQKAVYLIPVGFPA